MVSMFRQTQHTFIIISILTACFIHIMSIIVQRDATQSSLFITLQVHSTCFGCQPHPSSGVHKAVTTASGTGHIFCAPTSLQRGHLATLEGSSCTNIWQVPVTTLEGGTCTNIWQVPVTTLEGGTCTKNMTSIGSCSYSFVYSWWWVLLTPETRTVDFQNNK